MDKDRYLQIDGEGQIIIQNEPLEDKAAGHLLLSQLKHNEFHFTTELYGQSAYVEAFDQPLIVQQIHREQDVFTLQFNYEYKEKLDFKKLFLDEWDRFLGYSQNGLPYVFSRKAQAEFFNLLDDYDDDSVTHLGESYTLPFWGGSKPAVSESSYWTDGYKTAAEEDRRPGWDMGGPHYALPDVISQIKIPRSRILVLGCGAGHDAAFFAEQGHVVTGVDFSEEALSLAKARYGHLEHLDFMQADVFNLPKELYGQFDVVFEHTLFCAITPEKRNQLIHEWKKLLAENGKLLGIFFAMDRPQGPPFGSTEWELNERLRKDFQMLFWTRWKKSQDIRKACELIIFAEKST